MENHEREGRSLNIRQVLAELEMASCGTTANLNTEGHGAFGSRPPVTGDDDPPHLRYRAAYENAGTDRRRQAVLDAAIAELDRLRGKYERPEAHAEDPKLWKARMLREGEGFEPEIVAVSFNTTAKLVRSVRIKAGRFPGSGRPLNVTVSTGDRNELIRLVASQGATVTDIASHFELHVPTAWRIVKRAA